MRRAKATSATILSALVSTLNVASAVGHFFDMQFLTDNRRSQHIRCAFRILIPGGIQREKAAPFLFCALIVYSARSRSRISFQGYHHYGPSFPPLRAIVTTCRNLPSSAAQRWRADVALASRTDSATRIRRILTQGTVAEHSGPASSLALVAFKHRSEAGNDLGMRCIQVVLLAGIAGQVVELPRRIARSRVNPPRLGKAA